MVKKGHHTPFVGRVLVARVEDETRQKTRAHGKVPDAPGVAASKILRQFEVFEVNLQSNRKVVKCFWFLVFDLQRCVFRTGILHNVHLEDI